MFIFGINGIQNLIPNVNKHLKKISIVIFIFPKTTMNNPHFVRTQSQKRPLTLFAHEPMKSDFSFRNLKKINFFVYGFPKWKSIEL